MKKGIRCSFVAALSMSLLFGATAQELPNEKPTKPKKVNLSKKINRFSLDMLQHLAEASECNENMIMSPWSIYNNFAINYVGSAGETRDQLAKVLYYPEDDNALLDNLKNRNQEMAKTTYNKIKYYTANGVWIDKSRVDFKKDFLSQIKKYFPKALQEVKFSDPGTKDKINNWVERSTKNRIKNLLEEDLTDINCAMININTIYFKAPWKNIFLKEDTSEKKFYTTKTDISMVQMMYQETELKYSSDENFQFLIIPYTSDFSMYIFLPKKREGVKDFVKKLTWQTIVNLCKELSPQTVELSLPKFELENRLETTDYLKAMGIKDAFDSSKADFNKMYTKSKFGNLYISKTIQKTNISVSEAGTTAASASSDEIYFLDEDSGPENKKFNANHPFVFMIINHKNKNIVFTGWYSNPEKK